MGREVCGAAGAPPTVLPVGWLPRSGVRGQQRPRSEPLRLPRVSGDVEKRLAFFQRRSSLRYFILHFPEITWQCNRVGGAA